MAILAYFIFGEQLITIIFALITLYISITVLWKKHLYIKSKIISPILQINFWYLFCWSLATVIYSLYILILWRPTLETVLYEQKTLYIIGFPSYILMQLNTIFEAFIGMDRCFCILYPLRYSERHKIYFSGIAIFSSIIYGIALSYFNKFIDIFFENLKTNCAFQGCIILKNPIPFLNYIRAISTTFNGIIAITLFALIKYYLRHSTNNKATRRMHFTILAVMAFTVIFDVIPNLFSYFFQSITGETLAYYTGPYSSCFVSINILFGALIYYRTFKKSFQRLSDGAIVTIYGSRKPSWNPS